MTDPTAPSQSEGDIRIDGNITVTQGAASFGKGARASNNIIGAPGLSEPSSKASGPWWRRLSPWRLLTGLALAVLAFGLSLWLYPGGWDASWRTLTALAVAAVVGVTLFLDAARNAFTR